MNIDDFKASNGWLDSFKLRHNLTFSNICGESKDVNLETVDDFLQQLPEIIENYEPKNNANCDETAFFFRALPQKTLHKKGEKCFGGKHSKERLTVLLCCFADGQFEKPLVIGKSNNPRCFKNIKKENLPVTWRFNKSAWMTASLMEEWLIQLNKKMFIQKRHILLFMDNATCHPHLNLSNVKLVFFPPRTTSELQPLDSGIINAIKLHYRKCVLKRLISEMNNASSVSDLVKNITFLDAIYWLSKAVESLSQNTVPNCFRKAGFTFNSEMESDDEEDIISLAELRRLMDQANFNDLTENEYLHVDAGVCTEDETQFTNSSENILEIDDEEDDENSEQFAFEPMQIIQPQEVKNMLNQVKQFACGKGLHSLLEKTMECIHLVEDHVSSKQTKQSSITDFFSK